MDAENRTPNPDCAARNRPHGPHQLAGPGGNKPGSHCAGLSEEPITVVYWPDELDDDATAERGEG